MRLRRFISWLALSMCLWLAAATGEIVDRVDVVVDGQAIKESDVFNEIRVTDFLNGAKLDLGLAAQKQAANRLIEQKLIRQAMANGVYPPPDPAQADRLLKQVRDRSAGDAAYRRSLAAYGINEGLLKEHLLWQIAVLQFISMRFHAATEGEPATSGPDEVNQQFFAWLDETRKDARIDFKRTDLQ